MKIVALDEIYIFVCLTKFLFEANLCSKIIDAMFKFPFEKYHWFKQL